MRALLGDMAHALHGSTRCILVVWLTPLTLDEEADSSFPQSPKGTTSNIYD
jgi:hypothetical protein